MIENKLFEALLDVIPFKAYAVDVNTFEVVYANKIMRENMYAPQETYCWEKIFGQEEICSWCSIMDLKMKQQVSAKKDKHTIEFFDESDDKWLKSYDELMSWPDGREVKYSILVDITDQKEIQGSMIKSHASLAMKNKQMAETNKKLQITKLKLQQSVNEFEHLLNSTMEGILIFKDGKCKEINKQALKLFKSEHKDDFVGKALTDFINQDSLLIVQEHESVYNTAFEIQLVREDNTEFPALIQHANLLSRGLVVTSFIDLTELKEKDKLIQEQSKRIALGDMMGNIAHHWRQPLNVISTAASGMNLEKEMGILSDENFNSYVNRIMKNTNSLSETINIFSDFVEKKEDSKAPIEDVIYKTINIVSSSLYNSNIKLINTIDSNIKTNTMVSMAEISQVIINIINNAKDILINNEITDAWIKFAVEQEENTIIVTIEDNGGGIENDISHRIFEPYFTTKHKSQGTGISLNMCQKIMAQENGNIYFKNTENGAKFFLEFS